MNYKNSKIFNGSLFVIVLVLFLSACGSGGGGGGSGTAADTTPPTVSSTTPANNAPSVAVNSAITATFSEAMTASTITASTFTLSGGVSGAVSYDAASKIATFTPSASLAYSTTYTATITTGVKDSAANAMAADYTWSFTTGTAPSTLATTIGNLRDKGVVETGFLVGTATGGGLTAVEVQLDSGAWSAASGTTTWKSQLPTGAATWLDGTQHTISVRASNGATSSTPVTITVRKGVNKDVNGDGYADVVVGAGFANSSAGAVYVYHSKGANGLNSTSTPSTIATSAADTTLTGAASNDQFGFATALGDVNGDGYADVVVGACCVNLYDGGAYVFYSKGAYGLNSTSTPSTIAASSADTTFTAPTSGEFGVSLAIGDVNGDGYADLAVGADNVNSGTGAVYVFHSKGVYGFNSSSTPATVAASTADTLLSGDAGGDIFGSNNGVAMGDVNGDGYADVLVGASRANSYAGTAYVFLSQGTYGLNSSSTPGGIAAANANTILSGSGQFGFSVALGDMNGDGLADVAVGARAGSSAYVFYAQGSAGLCSSGSCTLAASAADIGIGGAVNSHLGQTVAVGDLNGDGYGDLVVGAPDDDSYAGAAYIFNSQGAAGLACTGSPCTTANTNADVNIAGSWSYGYFGYSLALADVNGDGYADVLVGAELAATQDGEAYVYHSHGATGIACTGTPCTNSSSDTTLTGVSTSSGRFGASIALLDGMPPVSTDWRVLLKPEQRRILACTASGSAG